MTSRNVIKTKKPFLMNSSETEKTPCPKCGRFPGDNKKPRISGRYAFCLKCRMVIKTISKTHKCKICQTDFHRNRLKQRFCQSCEKYIKERTDFLLTHISPLLKKIINLNEIDKTLTKTASLGGILLCPFRLPTGIECDWTPKATGAASENPDGTREWIHKLVTAELKHQWHHFSPGRFPNSLRFRPTRLQVLVGMRPGLWPIWGTRVDSDRNKESGPHIELAGQKFGPKDILVTGRKGWPWCAPLGDLT